MHREKVTKHWCVLAVLIMLSVTLQNARSQPAKEDPKPRLYVVATSHLDSQWNWTVQDTIREFVPNTFFENFKRFEKYPDYTFNYEGTLTLPDNDRIRMFALTLADELWVITPARPL